MAVVCASGIYLPRGLTFGPTNGPEDFQELVFICFSRRLYREWFLFLDDLSVATGRKPAMPPGPSGADDIAYATVEPQSSPVCEDVIAKLDLSVPRAKKYRSLLSSRQRLQQDEYPAMLKSSSPVKPKASTSLEDGGRR